MRKFFTFFIVLFFGAVGFSSFVHAADTTKPTTPANIRRVSDESDLSPSFVWDPSTDNVGVTNYVVKIDSGSEMVLGPDPNHMQTTDLAQGRHTIYVYAKDAAGNKSTTASSAFIVGDAVPPGIPGTISQSSLVNDTTPTFTWQRAYDDIAVNAYEVRLLKGTKKIFDWTNIGNTTTYTLPYEYALTLDATKTYSYTFSVRALDEAKNVGTVRDLSFETPLLVVDTSPVVSFPAGFVSGDLVKLADDHNPATTADSAVYYLGGDGSRYVFPSAKVYFTWYSSFNNVRIIPSDKLASLSIGGNVTYRPGSRMLKLRSSPKVYAVSTGGVLREIPSETIARALYGTDWNTKIDDLDDSFWTHYTTGDPLYASTLFSPDTLYQTIRTINLDKGL